MATAIHHGPPGSFKSFTLVQRHIIPALRSGRVVVTNIRGLDSIDRIVGAFPDELFPPTAQIIWVNTTTQKGRLRMAQWWHWVPFGVLIVIDEIQQVYPDRSDFKLTALDKYTPDPSDLLFQLDFPSADFPEGRPEDVFTAFDKQRHYNWDLFASTTNIAKVKKEIREVAEWAYRHRATSGLLPWMKNTWVEQQHDPESSGKSLSHLVGSYNQYKADPRVFACYDSTATGEHVKVAVGRSIFQDPKIRAVLIVLLFSSGYFFYNLFGYLAGKPDAAPVPAPLPSGQQPPGHPGGTSVPPPLSSKFAAAMPPSSALQPADVRRYSVMGIKPDDAVNLPSSCVVNRKRASCYTQQMALLPYATDYSCTSYNGGQFCHLYFFIVYPEPEKPLGVASLVQ